MSRKVILAAGLCEHIPLWKDADVIGVDRGALIAVRQKVSLRYAIGDFDSSTAQEKAEIAAACEIHTLPRHKNETDSEAAIQYALDQGYEEIILYGGLGGRMEHALANLYLLMHRDYPLTLQDEHHIITKCKPGTYYVKKQFTYLSLLALEPTIISESGVAYPLHKRQITPTDIYPISNEIIADLAEIIVHEGNVLLFQCEDVTK